MMMWTIIQEKAREQKLPLSTVVAEVIHLIILDALFGCPDSQSICFQGGTSIHLLYGGYRYSEDLDFAGEFINPSLTQQLISRSKSSIEKNVIQLLGMGKCEWRFPSFSIKRRIYAIWFNFQPQGKNQKYRVKLEFARYPIYESRVMPVSSNLDILRRRPLVTGLTAEELLAEKITAVAGRVYIKGRDLFDLWYLSKVLSISSEVQLVKKKFEDYRVSLSISDIEQRLINYDIKKLTIELGRFLPERYRRQLQKNDYEEIRETVVQIMKSVITNF